MARQRPWSRPRPLPRDAYVYDDPFLPVEEDVFVDDVDMDEVSAGGAPRFPLVQQAPRQTPATSLTWQQHLASLRSAMAQPWRPTRAWPERRELVYVFDVLGTIEGQALLLQVLTRDRLQRGGWGRLRPGKISHEQVSSLPRTT